MSVDLSVEFCGVKFKHPFLLSSSPAARVEVLPEAARVGWAGAVTWTAEIMCDVEPGGDYALPQYRIPHGVKFIDRPPAFWSFQSTHNKQGLKVNDPCPEDRVELVIRKSKESGLPVIANIVGTRDIDYWVKACKAAERAGADIVEVNPSYAILPGVGMHLGFHRNLDMTRSLVSAVRKEITKPIMVKLNAFLIPQEVREWAKVCVEAGADAISITNSLPGVIGVDVETGAPVSTFVDINGKKRGMVEIVTGPAIRPIGLASVALVDSVVDVPISAIGGVTDWYSAVEYMMLGASTIQVGSAAIAYGLRMVKDLTRGLEQFMERKGYRSINDMVGVTNREYRVGEVYSNPGYSRSQPRTMKVIEELCNGCGRCLPPCEISGRGAIKVTDGMATIDQKLCQKCNLCMLVCPEGAVETIWD
ncbi:MAG: 4Fe-4S binding protein [Dehalococcoidia bacterium]|nr:4Fe-4S binding protein [Dehalococcoidia bacterium]MDZ4246350.1 4Fe-4S binding protein [Dehalococcoidia bacterium]